MTIDNHLEGRDEGLRAPGCADAERPDGQLRATAIDCDARWGAVHDCSGVWQGLRVGGLSVVDHFSTGERAYLLLQQRASGVVRVAPRRWDMLQRILLGQSQKVVAIELNSAASTIAACTKGALRAIGINARVSSVPPILCMLVRAALRPPAVDAIRSTNCEQDGLHYRVLSMALKSSAMAERLSPAEQVVALMRIQGRSLAEIASYRHTSKRTVANNSVPYSAAWVSLDARAWSSTSCARAQHDSGPTRLNVCFDLQPSHRQVAN